MKIFGEIALCVIAASGFAAAAYATVLVARIVYALGAI